MVSEFIMDNVCLYYREAQTVFPRHCGNETNILFPSEMISILHII